MTLSTRDRLDILELLARADTAATRRDAATYVSFFTDDAVLDGQKGEHRGRSALADAVGPIWAAEGPASAHLTLNAVIDPVDGRPDRATATSTLVIVETTSTFTVRDVSTIVHQVVRTSQTWRIAAALREWPMTVPNTGWLPSADDPLFVLAMDHRASFAKDLFGISGTPTASDVTRMQAGKLLIYQGLQQVAGSVTFGRVGVLVDEDFGAAVIDTARRDGVVLAMPIEKSGSRVFELEYGDEFAAHIEAFDPAFFKVLVRYNPSDDAEIRRTQLSRLKAVSEWAERVRRRWLFELLVPPTGAQLSAYGDQDGYDRDGRPSLTAEVIAELQAGGVHPTIWKLEGYETAAGAENVLGTVAADTQHPAVCIVLGRDAPLERVEHWLEIAAGEHRYAGFAVGRTIWERPLQEHLAGRISDGELVERVTNTYRTLINTYTAASTNGRHKPA